MLTWWGFALTALLMVPLVQPFARADRLAASRVRSYGEQVSRSRLVPLFAAIAFGGLAFPAASPAQYPTYPVTSTVSARVTERSSPNTWLVEVQWRVGRCPRAGGKTQRVSGSVSLAHLETGEVQDVWYFSTRSGKVAVPKLRGGARERHLRPALRGTVFCSNRDYEFDIYDTGDPVILPPRFRAGSGGGGNGDYGRGDPTKPLRRGGCVKARFGANGPDRLTGSEVGDVMIGFGDRDRIRGGPGHDCLIGGSGNDRLHGDGGDDRITGGRGNDVLVGGRGVNAYDAGPGRDYVDARNGRRELVRCGRGRDRALIDRGDRVRSCERVL